MTKQELLRIARFYAESFKEICDEPVGDVAEVLGPLVPVGEDIDLLIAATLYSPVIHLMPSEDFVRQTYDDDIFDLLMDTTYSPELDQLSRLKATRIRMKSMDERARKLQMAVFLTFLDKEMVLSEREGRTAGDYAQWLEETVALYGPSSPDLARRILETLHAHQGPSSN